PASHHPVARSMVYPVIFLFERIYYPVLAAVSITGEAMQLAMV
ncbi:hypothetical protein chiPu_0021780, partial [Chiloscyllium punctatum]|nr:hypothetical protein [Chiloscyllium punctatum]